MRISHILGCPLLCSILCLTPQAQAGKNHITGQVVDRNGQPLARAVVSLSPGDVYLVTDREGWFLINYLREEDGRRTRLDKKVDYQLEVFKVGYHTYNGSIAYKRGVYEVDTVTMIEETVDVSEFPVNLDPDLYSHPTSSSAASYEGQ